MAKDTSKKARWGKGDRPVKSAEERAEAKSEGKEALKEMGLPPVITLQVGGQPVIAEGKKFSTGSIGYGISGKVFLGEEGTKAQFTGNIIIIGTKG